ncbi:hypothetical protein DPMN_135264 [Dreissena polymorpha]|uniref:Uncharacterized protein n=1 Tax=Dreissena polymorpha TaxID=45954 RepID=A0A9D4FXA0_DREPO|nr:hypothetical protein DPMN_135264 [Dreissena polymorpha]
MAPWWPYIIGAKILTKFHDDLTINVASRENAPPPSDIIRTNLLTKFHNDRKIIVVSRVLTRFYYSYIWKNAPLTRPCFQPTRTIFELIQNIIGTYLLTNLATRVLKMKKAPPHCGHFHDDRKIIVASRVLTRKNASPLVGHVVQPTETIYKLVKDITGTNLFTKLHEDRTIYVALRKKCPAPWRPFFEPTGINVDLVQFFIGTNLLTKFHEDRTINVASSGLKANRTKEAKKEKESASTRQL